MGAIIILIYMQFYMYNCKHVVHSEIAKHV
jgi:hypothetical protein